MGQSGQSVIYVVDDDAAVRKGLVRILQVNGFVVRSFGSAEQFLGELVEGERACVLLDITLNGTTGMQVQIELQRRGITWPVIAVSAREDEDTRHLSRELGARFFLRKPVDAQALLDAIAWVTGQRYGEGPLSGLVDETEGRRRADANRPGGTS